MAEGSNKAIKVLAITLGVALVVIGMFVARDIYLDKPAPAVQDAPEPVAKAPAQTAEDPPAQPVDPDALYLIQDSADGPVLTNQPGASGTILDKDGLPLLSAKGEPGPDPAPEPEAAAAEPGQEPAAPAAPAEPDAAMRAAVRDYLNQVASLQAGPAGVDPRKYADGIVAGFAKGDRGQFEDLIDEMERVRDQAARIRPPAPCGDHHKHLVSITEQSVDLLEELTEALDRKEAGKLDFITSRAKKIQDETKLLDALTQKLRLRYETN